MNDKKKSHVRAHKSFDRFRIMTAVLGALLIVSVFTNGFSGREETRLLVFLEPKECDSSCKKARETIMRTAEEEGIMFEKADHNQAKAPYFVLIYNGSALTSRFVNEKMFRQQICGFTGSDHLCISSGDEK